MKKLVISIVFFAVLICTNVSAIFANDSNEEDINNGCKLVELEDGTFELVCPEDYIPEEPINPGVDPCQIPCTLDCWGND
ncbi:MAG: hypothetical protein IJ359_01465 [Erysipelotrichaceae bacterium]|nr:hypothetical protein [Erysipelotrichaceae bacterium]